MKLDENTVYKNIGFQGSKVHQHQPENCDYCGSEYVKGIEVIGAKDGVLYWECEHCLEPTLRFSPRETKDYLSNTLDLHINLEGLSTIWQEQPN
tara:strand:+ start:1588 stop:1869 length:282 start_codon:yes stop_codon:yes gene_type:complete